MSVFNAILGSGLDFDATFRHRVIQDWNKLSSVIGSLRTLGARIVLTQGCFDMYHTGHGKYLLKARTYGDVLIVGVDSDELTRQRKGPKRPLDPEQDRLEALACVRGVDILTLRPACPDSELDALVRLIRPDVLITSETTADVDDKIRKHLSQFCGEVVALPPQASTSTTARLRRVAAEAKGELRDMLVQNLDKLIAAGDAS